MTGSRKALVRRADDVAAAEVAAGTLTRMSVLLGTSEGMPHFAMRRFTMQAGGGMPRHTNAVEHEQYVLRGRARVAIGEESFEVSEGNVLYIPSGVPHSYQVLQAPFEFLCLVPNLPDEIKLSKE